MYFLHFLHVNIPKTVGFNGITQSVLDGLGTPETQILSVDPQVVHAGSVQHPLTSWIDISTINSTAAEAINQRGKTN